MMNIRNLLVALLVTITSQAQNYIDLANLSYSTTPQNDFENSEESTAVNELEFQFTFPKVLDEKNTFISNV
ncbi:MAG: hypothetical protein NWQ06_10305, partial [Leeuwenhoekiella sp.]|nr:hypothetical protein [Leeuwenhoekiella sp.]